MKGKASNRYIKTIKQSPKIKIEEEQWTENVEDAKNTRNTLTNAPHEENIHIAPNHFNPSLHSKTSKFQENDYKETLKKRNSREALWLNVKNAEEKLMAYHTSSVPTVARLSVWNA